MPGSLGLVIDGSVVGGEAGTYPVTNPVRPAEVVLSAPAASPGQLDRAVAAARRAAGAWADLDPAERGVWVSGAVAAAGAAIETGDLARLLTREHGKVRWEAEFDVGTLGVMAEAFAPLAAATLAGRDGPGPGGGTRVSRAPHGVVAAVLPFNWPVSVLGNKVLPALLTGNTVVVKAPPTCPGAVLAVGAALAGALPPGVLNVLNGPGPELGAALVAHPGIDLVTFTGGVETGRAVMAGAARVLSPVVLELGGNDAAVVAPDVVFDQSVAARLIEAAFVTSGQVCMAVKRLYVQRDALDDAVEALVDRLSAEVVGDGLAAEVTMGPVHRAAARDRVEALIADAAGRGARVHRPGRIREEDAGAGGYLVNPALVAGVPPEADLVTAEQFAPALPVVAYKDLDQAVAMANATDFGLSASVWSNDPGLAASVAARLEAGTVFVNAHGMAALDVGAPMGGWGSSGLGVELGPEGMAALTRPKVVLTHGAPNTPGAPHP